MPTPPPSKEPTKTEKHNCSEARGNWAEWPDAKKKICCETKGFGCGEDKDEFADLVGEDYTVEGGEGSSVSAPVDAPLRKLLAPGDEVETEQVVAALQNMEEHETVFGGMLETGQQLQLDADVKKVSSKPLSKINVVPDGKAEVAAKENDIN